MSEETDYPHPVNEKQIRDAGFSGASGYRDNLALQLLCAFNGVDPAIAPPGWWVHPNSSSKAAWHRVADLVAAAEARGAERMREEAARAVEQEAVTPDASNPDPTDISYNCALDHAADATRALPTPGAPQ